MILTKCGNALLFAIKLSINAAVMYAAKPINVIRTYHLRLFDGPPTHNRKLREEDRKLSLV